MEIPSFSQSEASAFAAAFFDGTGKRIVLNENSGALSRMLKLLSDKSRGEISTIVSFAGPSGPDEETIDSFRNLSSAKRAVVFFKSGADLSSLISLSGSYSTRRLRFSEYSAAVFYKEPNPSSDIITAFIDDNFRESAPAETTPEISVILPVHNRRKFIENTIASVMCQTFPDWELLIMDDGSTDGTPELLKSFCDPRIKKFRQENQGASVARNELIKKSEGKYIVYLDDDDILLPYHLELLREVLLNDLSCGYVWGDTLYFSLEGKVPEYWYFAASRWQGRRQYPFFITDIGFYMGSFMIRRELQEKAGFFDPEMIRGQDMDMFRKFTSIGRGRCVCLPVNGVRVHPDIRGTGKRKHKINNHFRDGLGYTSSKHFRCLEALDNKIVAGLESSKAYGLDEISVCRTFLSLIMHNHRAGYEKYFSVLQDLFRKPLRGSVFNLIRGHLDALMKLPDEKFGEDSAFSEVKDFIRKTVPVLRKSLKKDDTSEYFLWLDEGYDDSFEKAVLLAADTIGLDAEISGYFYYKRKKMTDLQIKFGTSLYGCGRPPLPSLIEDILKNGYSFITIASDAYTWRPEDMGFRGISTAACGTGQTPVYISLPSEYFPKTLPEGGNTPAYLNRLASGIIKENPDVGIRDTGFKIFDPPALNLNSYFRKNRA